MQNDVVLTMRGIVKLFPGTRALDGVDFTLRKGEVHALMGENGAGKSTLIKVLTGVYEKDAGSIWVEGSEGEAPIHSPQDAQNAGISTVYQEITLCPNLTVAENMFIGRTKGSRVNWKEYEKRADELLSNLGIPARAKQELSRCSLAVQQMVAIARAVDMNCKVLILDEPTSSLDDKEVEMLFGLMRDLKSRGVGIIFVTHFLEQVYAVCDRITVLRNGELEGEFATADLPRLKLVQTMLGHEVAELDSLHSNNAIEEKKDVPIILKAVALTHTGTIKPFSVEIKKGEVVGLTGLLGSGRSEMARAIYGADRPDGGQLTFNGKDLKAKSPLDSIKSGMAFLPEDRKAESIIADLSIRENMMIALQAKTGVFKLLPMAKQLELTNKYIKALSIKTPSPETLIKQLSGGNQQKVIIGRWLVTNPEFLILDEPTRGIDVGTKTEIQKLVIKLAEEGMTVMFISSEIDEMLRTVNKLCVMRDGAKVGELMNDNLTQDDVMKAIAGGDK